MRSALVVGLLVITGAAAGCLRPGLDDASHASLPAALLRDDPHARLLVQIDHAPGTPPCTAAIAAFVATLQVATRKSIVDVVGPAPVGAGGTDHSNEALAALHRATAHPRSDAGDTAYLHVMYLEGRPEASDGGHVAGRTLHEHGAIFVFKDTFRGVHRLEGSARSDATCDVERAVLLHELGHAFGLVNRGIPMLTDRESGERAGHSTNPGSAMYATLSLAPDGLLLREPPRGFDVDDWADLRAFQAAA